MKKIKGLIIIGIAMLAFLCAPMTAMASDAALLNEDNQAAVNLMEDGFIVVDAEGNIVPQPRFEIGKNAILPANGTVFFYKDCWYNGGDISFYISVTGGNVSKLQLETYSGSNEILGMFTATQGDWYGHLLNRKLSGGQTYYNYLVKNTSNVELTIDSLTALN